MTTYTTKLRWTALDGLTLVGRAVMFIRRQPGQLLGAVIFPGLMVVRHLDRAGASAADVAVRRPTLDEVFLRLTEVA